MPAPDDNDRDEALLRRLYDEPDADHADGELAREVESYRRVRGAIADYARATEVEPPSRGLDELLAAARQRAPARAAAQVPEAPGFWARLRAWLAPIAAHPALASAAMVVLVAGVAGVLYLKGKTKVTETEVSGARTDHAAVGTPPAATETAPSRDNDRGMVAGLDDAGQGSAAGDNQANAPRPVQQGPIEKPPTKTSKPGKPRPSGGTKAAEGQGGDGFTGAATERGVAVGPGKVVTDDTRPEHVPATEASVPKTPAPPPVGTTATATSTPEVRTDDALLAGSVDELEETMPEGGKDKRSQTGAQKMDQLTRQARTAAKSGDCGVVKSIGGRVKKANATYYKQTFSADATIKKCL